MSLYLLTEQRDIEDAKDRGQAEREQAAIQGERFGEFDLDGAPPVLVGTFADMLRDRAHLVLSQWDGRLLKSAAREIERLEAENARLRTQFGVTT